MRNKVTFAYKVFRTLFTGKGAFALLSFSVTSLVEEEISLQGERFATSFTCKRAISSVTAGHVVDQMFFASERLVAHVAAMWVVA